MDNKKNKPLPSKVKISRVSVVDQVSDTIKNDIVSGVWQAGDKLPSEADFAEAFGVNRLSVRMALQKLGTLGLIETRVGEGSFVVERFSLRPFLSEIAVLYDKGSMYEDVQQLRNLLEGECMNLAVLHGNNDDVAILKETLENYHQKSIKYYNNPDSYEDLNNLVDADFDFHYTIVKMSHNKLYKDVYFMVQELIRGNIMQLLETRIKNRQKAGLPPILDEDSHNEIYNCIVNKDVDRLAKSRMEVLGILPIKGLDIFE